MGHNIEYYSYPEKVDRKKVQRQLDAHVAAADYQEGSSGLPKNIEWMDHFAICKNREEAEELIKRYDNGWYDQRAARYYEPEPVFNNKTFASLKEKSTKMFDAYMDKDRVIWAKEQKAEYVSCRHCGSKLKRDLIRVNRCPVCGKDLRPESTLKAIEAAKKRYTESLSAVTKYQEDHSPKSIKWLVKIEYHT